MAMEVEYTESSTVLKWGVSKRVGRMRPTVG